MRLRFFAFLAFLLAAALPAQAQMVPTILNGQPDQSRWMMVGEHFRYDGALITSVAGTVDEIVRLAIITPKWGCNNPRFVFAGSYGKETANNPETAVGNSYTIEGAVIETTRGTTQATLAFSGVATATVASGNNFSTSDSPGIFIPGNSSAGAGVSNYYLVADINVASAGQFYPTYLPNPITGEGAVQSATTQTAKLTSSASLGSSFPGSGAFAPVTMFCQGSDGSPVVLIGGDSLGQGNGDAIDKTRGTRGYTSRGLDNVSGGQLAYTNWAVGSTNFGATSEGAITSGNYGNRIAIINAIAALNANSALPFTSYIADGGTNNASTLSTTNTAFWSMIHTQFPGIKIYQVTIAPHTDDAVASKTSCPSATAANNSCWTNSSQVPDQSAYNYPSGTVTVFNAALLAGGTYNCSAIGGTSCEDGVIDVTPYSTAPSSQIWANPVFTTTFAQSASGGASTVHLTACPTVGDAMVLGPLTTNAEAGTKDNGGLIVATAVLGADCAVTFTGGNTTIANAHTAGDAVAEAITNSGLHPNQMGAVLMSAALVTAKTNSIFAANDNRVRLVIGPGHWVRRAA